MKLPQFARMHPAAIALALLVAPFAYGADDATRPLRIIAFGAHPDDAEFRLSGCAAKWAKLGHKVKFVSLTNGDIGHWNSAGGPLARRRLDEVKEAARRIGVESEVVDIHDGELLPTLESRRIVTRLIREWQADLVFSHRPWDYHPDHRYAAVLVQDAAFMVTVPYFAPDVPALKTNPVFFYFSDNFTKPYPFSPDIAVGIDDVQESKLAAVDALVSQIYEGGANGSAAIAQQRSADDPVRRREFLRNAWFVRQDREKADRYRDLLVKWYGEEAGRVVKHVEAFELCEYGRRPREEELRRLFPFFPKVDETRK